jgi:hypothetical protein
MIFREDDSLDEFLALTSVKVFSRPRIDSLKILLS